MTAVMCCVHHSMNASIASMNVAMKYRCFGAVQPDDTDELSLF